MNNLWIENISRYVFLVLLQVALLDNIWFLGYVNPYLYVFFILLLPLNLDQWKVLLISFLAGLSIDMFHDSGGVHASACLVIAYFRPYLLRWVFGVSFEHQTLKYSQTPFRQRMVYVSIMVVIHHFILFLLEYFDLSFILLILKKTLFSSIFTILLIIIGSMLFKRNTST
ncbi:MAG: rod shape-determining protein MreD [Mesonia hippocampi]|uniref:rod shape-determining protein MreD n=1 Tax=Mesonia hippocampi TaxID=1628250 RepID=UPI003F9CAE6A